MQNLVNKDKKDKWIHPWQRKKFDDVSYRDDRFFSILIKGVLSWLTNNIELYGEPIKHFILTTGSSYMYVESNGYSYDTKQTSGEDQIYMKTPRCVCSVDDVSIPIDELTQPFIRGNYERQVGDDIVGMNAEVRRLPISMTMNLKYVLSTFNEGIVLLQEIFDKLIFNRYFRISYLGQNIQCLINFPSEEQITVNKVDMASTDVNQKTIEFSITVLSAYPQINERTEIRSTQIISSFGTDINLHRDINEKYIDKETYKKD